MWRVRVISCARTWRAPEPGGCQWAETGVRTGSQTRFWWARPCPSASPAATAAPQPRGTSLHPIGNSVKLSPERISGSEKNPNHNHHPCHQHQWHTYIYFLSWSFLFWFPPFIYLLLDMVVWLDSEWQLLNCDFRCCWVLVFCFSFLIGWVL